MDRIPAPLAGGFLLSYATSSLLLNQGRILGCSGVAHSTIDRLVSALSPSTPPPSKSDKTAPPPNEQGWKIASVLGILAGGVALRTLQSSLELVVGQSIFDPAGSDVLRPLLAGLAVGAGTKLARGCTSGHMLLGMARFSKRSFVATFTFFPVAILVARLFPYVLPISTSASIASLNLSYVTPSIASLFLVPFASSLIAYRFFSPRLASIVQSFSLSFLFSLGLAITGMTRPSKVLSFFYLPIDAPFETSSFKLPSWDPSLAFVAVGGLLPNMITWITQVKGRSTPRERKEWEVPSGGQVDKKLILGSALFGIGWGLVGICPGPMLTVLGSGTGGRALSIFAGAFALGGYVANHII